MPDTSLDAQLRFAIASKRLLELSYSGATRVSEPHDDGVHKGVLRLLTYQLRAAGGGSQNPRGWRMLDVAKISSCSVLEESFPGSRGEAHRQHYVWDELHARVK
jgi:hypothetical protein